ncbi:hypothetical protein M9978_16395 [Sphingomonas sp. MG17]|uniref:Uncharacterized protein n=1 Tax=Sphingomonas tagetis TaxID=2949092 RepID=A0A9X2HP67_9SPHN|nr:hypothetical protein [Sphingomonas tagetis]MCP3732006.1 hypothetical protein [Sphingomonas tagetis]
MPALPADIAAGTRSARIETWSDPDMKTRYPNARDGSETPSPAYFDSAANAVTALVARGALIGVERRRFKVVVDQLVIPHPELGMPTVTLRDTEQAVDAPAIVCRVECQPETEQTIYEVMA